MSNKTTIIKRYLATILIFILLFTNTVTTVSADTIPSRLPGMSDEDYTKLMQELEADGSLDDIEEYELYPANIAPSRNGKLILDSNVSDFGAERIVDFHAEAERGYVLSRCYGVDRNGNVIQVYQWQDSDKITRYSVSMPEGGVTLHAEFSKAENYRIDTCTDLHSHIDIKNKIALNGSTVSFSVNTDNGYAIKNLYWRSVSNNDINGIIMRDYDHDYSFEMPNHDIELVVTTMAAEEHVITLPANNDTLYNPITINKTHAVKDEMVFITHANKNEAYQSQITVVDKHGEMVPVTKLTEGQWSFYMAETDVSIQVYEWMLGLEVEEPSLLLEEDTASDMGWTEGETLTLETEATEVPVTYSRLRMMVRNNRAAVSHKTSASVDGGDRFPDVTITKDAKWTDIENGYAEITLTEEDTSSWVHTPIDTIVAIDRSDSTMLELHYLWAYWNNRATSVSYWLPGESPCQNPAHCYKMYDGNFYWMMTWYWGVNVTTRRLTQFPNPYPEEYAEVYWKMKAILDENGNQIGIEPIKRVGYLAFNHHHDIATGSHIGMPTGWAPVYDEASGTWVADENGNTIQVISQYSLLYEYGCKDRHLLELDAVIELIGTLNQYELAQNADNTMPPCRISLWQFCNRDDFTNTGTFAEATVPRISPEDIASAPGTVNGVDFSNMGITNYLPLTETRNNSTVVTLQTHVQNLGMSVGGGTDYGPSFRLAYETIRSREGTIYEHAPVKFYFFTDSMEEDVPHATGMAEQYANLMKSYDKADVIISAIAVAMPKNARTSPETKDDMEYLASLTSQNVISNGQQRADLLYFTGDGTLTEELKASVTDIAGISLEVKASNKVYTDIVSNYYDVVSVSTSHGSISHSGNNVTWNIPTGEKTEYKATVRIKLKDQYRYLISDTKYPTNTDVGNDYGADLKYRITGGYYGNDPAYDRYVSTKTPILPYGTVEISGDKYWAVENSELESVTIHAERSIVGANQFVKVGSDKTENNQFHINRRSDNSTIPLVLYNNNEELYEYRVAENGVDYYYNIKNDLDVLNNGLQYEAKYLNMPNGADADGGVTLKKLDYHTGKAIKDAEFTVFAYGGTGDENDLANYNVYCYTPYEDPEDYDYKGIVTTVPYDEYKNHPEDYDAVKLLYSTDKKLYVNTQPLYYTPENKGLFKVVETKTPNGYYGDWKEGITPDENSTYLDRNSYNVVINPVDKHQQFVIFNEDTDNTFRNKAIRSEILIRKTGDVATGYTEDEDGNKNVTYETKGLPGAWYVVRAAEDIYDPQGNVIYQKGDIVEPMESKQTHYYSLSDLDLSMYGAEEESTHIVHVGETVSENLLVSDEEGLAIKGTIVTKTEYMNEDYVASDLFDDFVLNKETGEIIFCDGAYSTDKVFITDTDGIAKVNFLDQGSYEIVEVKAPAGYVRGRSYVVEADENGVMHNRPTNSAYANFNCTEEWTDVVTKEVSFYNERQKPATPGIPEEPPVEKDNNPSIMITKKADKEFYFPGEEVTYTVTVSNNGDVDLKDVVVDDVMDELPDSKRVVATFDSLLIGEYQTFTYNYTIPETDKDGTVHDNVVTVVGTSEPDKEFDIPEKTVTDQDDAKIKVKTGLGILKTTDRKIYMNGETINYTIYVTNNTVVSANTLDDMEGYKKEVKDKTLLNLVIEDKLLTAGVEDLTYVSTDMPKRVSVMDDGNILIDYLEPQEVCMLTYTARITDDFTGDVVDNEVTVTSSDGQTDDDDEQVYVKNPEIKVTKVADKKDFSQSELTDTVSSNNIVNYTITVTNTGDCDLKDVRLQDTVLTEGEFLNDITMEYDGNRVANTKENAKWFNNITVSGNSANVGLLPIGASKTLTYTYTLTPEDAGKKIPNIVVAKGDTVPEHPDEPIITVTDKDDEKINAGIAVGLQKLSDKGGTPIPTEGAVFAMYAAEDIVNIEGTVIFPKDTLIEMAVTDKYGYANFNSSQLPIGEYVVKEIKAPQGCYPSDMVVHLHFDDYKYNDNVYIVHDGGIFRNSGVRLLVYLYDDNTMNELSNAQLEVTDVSGNSIDSWVTKNTDGDGYLVYGCEPGVKYILREKTAREGYVNEIVRDLSDASLSTNSISKTEIGFMIPEETPQTYHDENEELYGKIVPTTEPNTYRLRITNDFVEGTLRIYKTGEYLDAWNFFEKAKHFIYSIYTFFTGPLGDIEFTVTANEDIYHPDGVTGLLYKKGDIVDVGVKSIRSKAVALTDDAGMATFEQMYLGEYTVSETRGKEGLFATAPINFSLAYLDEKTPIVYATEKGLSINNVQQVVQVNITKIDKNTSEALAGAEFELYAAEDIKNRDGKVITKKDTLLESGIITDENGEAHVESILAVGHTYYLKEVKAPANYKIDKENLRIEFSTAPENFTDEYMIFNLTVKDTRNDDKIIVDKTAPETAVVGQSIRYDIITVKNESRVPVDKFTLQDTLPENVYMTTLYTGSYNATVSMNILYKTNLSSDWKIWRRNVRSSQAVELTTTSLKLKEKEYITEFAIDYGTVPAGFSVNEGDRPYYFVTIGNAKTGTTFINKIKLTGYVDGKKLESDDSTVTRITTPRKTPQTGDDDMMFGFFLVMMILAIIALIGYCAYNHFKKKKEPEDDFIRPKKTLFSKKVPNVPLSELVDKKKK